jgi:hypothetical protein
VSVGTGTNVGLGCAAIVAALLKYAACSADMVAGAVAVGETMITFVVQAPSGTSANNTANSL